MLKLKLDILFVRDVNYFYLRLCFVFFPDNLLVNLETAVHCWICNITYIAYYCRYHIHMLQVKLCHTYILHRPASYSLNEIHMIFTAFLHSTTICKMKKSCIIP